MIRVIVHVLNDDPFIAELETLPDPRDHYLKLKHPRRRDGKRLPTLTDSVTTILFPWQRITFIELLDEPEPQPEGLLTIFRDEPERTP
ncbi:hypothetical protein OO015_01235 [Thermomicrobium sp. 4228-Ro]|uniref:hypothetical protein n=1 Tax=Thermomicrobium sp. 4228-Ro TaxID=2993937 RepID=UPI0022487B77|nr:hypothetical protein [Thermomicrobium sp. 4228-Ro]MCX2726126.1 hypothetical protein [Thermomicrobium sp. 4228-Ro]